METMAGARRQQHGFTLIELMIALVLGLVVVAAAGGVFLSNKKIYGAAATTGRLQENQRAAFELLARDIREAAGSPCSGSPPVNMLQSRAATFWSQFPNGLTGTNGTGTNPDSVDLYMANDGEVQITSHDNPSAVLDVSDNSGVAVGDILMACNADVSIVFQVTMLPSGTIQHNGGGSSGNCGQEFQHRNPDLSKCAGASQDFGYCFVIPPGHHPGPGCTRIGQGPASVVRLSVVRWEIKDNGRGGKSLYRSIYLPTPTGLSLTASSSAEIAEGVTDMQLKYQSDSSAAFQDAPVADWKHVVAVQAMLRAQAVEGAVQGEDIKGTDHQALTRVMTSTIALRNRAALL
ncbi:prepilin-type N-terminal cleavage/methylation domain-containing protein [Cognatilysobacter lacus]|nr:prepilin-type N-terminal cleavage/methylation domain-containing protein [Lysobacter lacus]